MNYFDKTLISHKAALHSHSTVSDGKFTPAEMISFYSSKGYDIYAFTDHHKTNPVSTYDSKGMLLLSGMEIHPNGPRGIKCHFVGLGLPEDFTEPSGTPQDAIDAVNAAGGIIFCAHPHWCGFTSAEVQSFKGIAGIEVYNTSTRYIGRQFNMQLWDELSDADCILPAIAVDDAHSPHDFFMGWTNILTEGPLTAEKVLNALRNGQYYATMGPEFTSIRYHDGIFEADFTPCTEVIGISFLNNGICAMCDNFNGPQDGVQEITHCSFLLKDKPRIKKYFRLQIKDRSGHYAWTNPIIL